MRIVMSLSLMPLGGVSMWHKYEVRIANPPPAADGRWLVCRSRKRCSQHPFPLVETRLVASFRSGLRW